MGAEAAATAFNSIGRMFALPFKVSGSAMKVAVRRTLGKQHMFQYTYHKYETAKAFTRCFRVYPMVQVMV